MIPAELLALPQWVGWRYETRKGRPTKVPLSPHTEQRASSTDPSTWGSWREAMALLADGVGFVFSADDPYVGVDLDACFLPSGALHPAAWNVVARLDGYYEPSPSGNGLHIIVRGRLERGRHTLKTEWGDEFAVYSSGRFFTMRGDGRGQIQEAQDALNYLVSYYFPEPRDTPRVTHSAPFSDDDGKIVDKVLANDRMAALWRGDTSEHGGDHSAADLALCAHLGWLTGNDRARIDGLFRRSGLMRDKWNEPRGDSTYGAVTIAKATR